MYPEKIKVGVIGVGIGAAVHIPGFQACPDTEVVAVSDINAGLHAVISILAALRVREKLGMLAFLMPLTSQNYLGLAITR